ncbi:hypothetical protein BC832DRAFT_390005 [Gaertneriomyces semiglobifer]|nr:hypothetical protein BC832DRAFT_390005 [Gaertneriomyces semiglobifer]
MTNNRDIVPHDYPKSDFIELLDFAPFTSANSFPLLYSRSQRCFWHRQDDGLIAEVNIYYCHAWYSTAWALMLRGARSHIIASSLKGDLTAAGENLVQQVYNMLTFSNDIKHLALSSPQTTICIYTTTSFLYSSPCRNDLLCSTQFTNSMQCPLTITTSPTKNSSCAPLTKSMFIARRASIQTTRNEPFFRLNFFPLRFLLDLLRASREKLREEG